MNKTSAYISSLTLIDGLVKLSNDLSNYVDKVHDASLSGNIDIYNANLSVLSGDIVQTNGSFIGGESSIAERNSFAYGTGVSAISENSYAVGKNSIAGCYGWYYDHIDFQNNAFYLTLTQPIATYTSSLTGEGTVDTSFDSGLSVGDIISYVNKAKFDMELSVAAVNGNKITVQSFKNTSQYKLDEATPNHDDWSIFCPDKPVIGQIQFGEAAYSAGLDCKAINAYSHAEGKQNLAYGQYSHVEGYKNRGAYATHAEGKGNYADGQCSHAEGWNTRTQKDCAHAEGNETSAYNECAHAEGHKTLAFGLYSHAEGNQTSAVGTDSHTFGNKTYASGYCSFAGGDAVSATNSEAFAIGWKTSASGQYSFAGGQNTKSTANQSFVFGNSSEANGGSSFASGWKCVADKDNTYAFGLSAIADHKESFVWNAKSNERYVSKGQGTFCINPANGSNGFYIGNKTLDTIIDEKVAGGGGSGDSELKETIANALTAAGIQADTALSDISFANVLSVIHNLQSLIQS